MESFSDGKVRKISEDSFQIEISSLQTKEHKNFKIAYQLGHLFLHMGFVVDKETWNHQRNKIYYREDNSVEKYLAYQFAMAFLMPEEEYKRIMNKNTDSRTVNTQSIAEYFNVPAMAASNRGKILGYLQRW